MVSGWRRQYWKRANDSITWEEYCIRPTSIPEPDRQKICMAKLAGVGRVRLVEEYKGKYTIYQLKLLLIAFRNMEETKKEEYGYNIVRI